MKTGKLTGMVVVNSYIICVNVPVKPSLVDMYTLLLTWPLGSLVFLQKDDETWRKNLYVGFEKSKWKLTGFGHWKIYSFQLG